MKTEKLILLFFFPLFLINQSVYSNQEKDSTDYYLAIASNSRKVTELVSSIEMYQRNICM